MCQWLWKVPLGIAKTYDLSELDIYVVLRIEGDTIVNDLVYHKVYHNDAVHQIINFKSRKLLALIRDDLPNKKVYGGFIRGVQFGFEALLDEYANCNWFFTDQKKEYLLYDFNLEVGDTVDVYMRAYNAEVISIDSVIRHDFKRKTFHLKDTSGYSMISEGRGTCIGIFKGQDLRAVDFHLLYITIASVTFKNVD